MATPLISAVVGTFGDEEWRRAGEWLTNDLTRERQFVSIGHEHGDTLAAARNEGARKAAFFAGAEWFVFVDADDNLEDGYAAAMIESINEHPDAAIHRPATRGVYADGTVDDNAVLIPKRDLAVANYIVIGACVNAAAFRDAGGFGDYDALEDWALWRAVVAAGGTVVDVPDAVYQVGVRPESRNQDTSAHRRAYLQIRREVPL